MGTPSFHHSPLWSTPIRDLGLAIAGTHLERVIDEFRGELERAGIRRLRPDFYLSTEWGVNSGTIGIAIPFYLARADVLAIHAQATGIDETFGPADLLRYLRHEMGHVVNYAYLLHERDDWIQCFGLMSLPYEDDYRPRPFDPRFVRHLPGWYAQKHPDEDWAETFAVWMAPGADWRRRYADAPTALAKLEYCDRVLAEVRDLVPPVTAAERDEDVSELTQTLAEHYTYVEEMKEKPPTCLDDLLQSIFASGAPGLPASELIHRQQTVVTANVHRYTGHLPQRIRPLLRFLASRADALGQVYAPECEGEKMLALTALVTALAMNFVCHGQYDFTAPPPARDSSPVPPPGGG